MHWSIWWQKNLEFFTDFCIECMSCDEYTRWRGCQELSISYDCQNKIHVWNQINNANWINHTWFPSSCYCSWYISRFERLLLIPICITKPLYLKTYPILLSFFPVIYGLSTFSIDYNAPIPILLIRYTTAKYYNRKKICVKRNSTK